MAYKENLTETLVLMALRLLAETPSKGTYFQEEAQNLLEDILQNNLRIKIE